MMALILILCTLLPLVTAGNDHYGNIIKSMPQLLQHDSELDKLSLSNDFDIRHLYSKLLQEGQYGRFLAGANISEVCLQNLNATIRAAIITRETWALRFLDATGKIPSGILNGNIFWMGEYDECVNSTATIMTGPNSSVPTHPFNGQYCKLGIPLGATAPSLAGMGEAEIPIGDLQLGVCMPNTCSRSDVLIIFNSVLGLVPFGNTTLHADVAVCYDGIKLDTKAIISITVLSFLGLIVVIGTIYDVFVIHRLHASQDYEHLDETEPLVPGPEDHNSSRNIKFRGYSSIPAEGDGHSNEGKSNIQEGDEIGILEIGIGGRVLQAFSLYTNGSKLLSTKSGVGTLGAVNGIRFLSMSWVILGHSYAFLAASAKNIYPFIQSHVKIFSFMTILNATVAVDTFFLLSGLLVAYLSLKELRKVGGVKNFKWGMFYFHRFWRLTPTYGLIMLLYIPLLRYVSNGPFWSQRGTEKDFCENNFWMNLLYVNNLFKSQDTGGVWGYKGTFLLCQLKYFWLFYMLLISIIYLSFSSSIFGGLVCFGFLITSFTVTGVLTSHYYFPMNIIGVGGDPGNTGKFFDTIYTKPYCRIGPYIVGMIFGYIMYKTDCKKRISRFQNLLGWLVATACCLSTLYGNFDSIRGTHIPSKEENALHNALSSSVWGLGVGWVVYACATGYGGIINSFLSWKLFIPLSRLTYISYLIHPVIMEIYYMSKRDPIYITDFDAVYFFFGHLIMANGAAFVLSLLFESPFMGLEKAFFRRQRKH
ncbi:nose resistant to fluoxetine protein 6-like [Ruditapes philippinarum]|uniref:nose resistant to fluoxetine protein 6-like n=1 Tax=Ruditapes philippinarum TaxID=129788 RepID=UPI00295B8200|nr:nose resistant to fluoxetine protein 6-like [Ruditapes philippinarum]